MKISMAIFLRIEVLGSRKEKERPPMATCHPENEK